MSEIRSHFGACNLCEAICGLEFKVDGTQILAIRGDDADPFSRGHICPKAVALKDLYQDPDRLKKPIRRTESGWVEMEWDAAFDWVAERLAAIIQRDGGDAVGVYLGNPTVHNYGMLTHGPHFIRQLGSKNRYSATSVDQLPSQLMSYWLYGHQLLLAIPDIDRTMYFLVIGANPVASNGSLMTVPDFKNRLKALQGRGGKMVVIDPRRSETAELADAHHFIKPSSDAAFLLALIHTLLADGDIRSPQLSGIVDGLDAVRAAVIAFTPEAVAEFTTIPAATTRQIASDLLAQRSVVYGRMGTSVQTFGSLCQWAIQIINIITGALDAEGGALFTTPAVDLVDNVSSKPGHFDKWRSRVSGLPEFAGELPVVALAEEILTPGAGQIKAMVTGAGNPVLSTPDGRKLDQAFQSLEFMVSIDIYLNETTCHADVILPPTCALEHDHYDLIFHHFAVRNSSRYNQALFEKSADARHDWQIFEALTQRLASQLGRKPAPSMRPDQLVDMGLQMGPYGASKREPESTIPALSLRTLKAHPHGIDLGPLRPSLPARLATANQRINLAVPQVLADIPRLNQQLQAPAETTLTLIGRRHIRSNNSWLHNSERLVKGKTRHQLLMHPNDLKQRQLQTGDMVQVTSVTGSIQVEVEASLTMMPGVVSLPHGFGHDRSGVRLSIAQAHAGVSANDLTSTQLRDAVSGNAALNGMPVTVEAYR